MKFAKQFFTRENIEAVFVGIVDINSPSGLSPAM